MLPQLPTPPSRNDPTNFSDRADAFLESLPDWADAANALEQSLQLVATTGTSTTPMDIYLNTKDIDTQPGKAWVVGAYVYLVSASSIANLMMGQVTAYNPATGFLQVQVTFKKGSGSFSSWIIGLAAADQGDLDHRFLGNLVNAWNSDREGNHRIYFERIDGLPSTTFVKGYGAATAFIVLGNDDAYNFQVFQDGRAVLRADAIYPSDIPRLGQVQAMLPSAVGLHRTLRISASGTTAGIALTCDQVVVENAAGIFKTLRSINLTSLSVSNGGVNGLDTGALTGGTWYSVWIIWNGTTVAGLLSLSATAPTMPAGYTYKARVGCIRTDGTASKFPLAFKQEGRRVQPVVAGNVAGLPALAGGVQGNISNAAVSWAAVSVSNFVPPTATAIHVLAALPYNQAGTVAVAPSNAYGGFDSTTNPPPFCLSIGVNSRTIVPAWIQLESSNIYYASDLSGAQISLFGWEDDI